MAARTCASIQMVITTAHATMDLLSETTESLVKKVILLFCYLPLFLKKNSYITIADMK